jgi:formylglycine-generating enzyme
MWNDGWTVHAPVGTFAPNGFGLHDVIGNVWEWCRDHHVDYRMAVMGADAFRRGSSGQSRVLRGGSFYDDAANSRVSLRFNGMPETGGYSIGVRPAMRIAGATEASSRPAPR